MSQEVTRSAGWTGDATTSVVFDNKMWVMGGKMAPAERMSGHYPMAHHGHRQQVVLDGPRRHDHTPQLYPDNKMWVMGGYDGSNRRDVWYSTDGTSWTQASSAGWTGRYDHTSVVFDNKMWVMGGYDGSNRFNDVWYSTDGTSWTQATSSAGWTGRQGHTSVVLDNKMWVMGGYDGSNRFNDVWKMKLY